MTIASIKDPPGWVVDWAQILGAVFGALALALALLALQKARRDAAREAHRQHDLELLRDIGSIVGKVEHLAGPDGLIEGYEWNDLRTRLLLLKTRDDFRLTRFAVEAHPSENAESDFERRYGTRVEERTKQLRSDPQMDDEWTAESLKHFRLALLAVPSTGTRQSVLREELDAAIEARLG